MKAVIQRIKSASVTVDSEPVASTGPGVMVLVAVGKGDDEKEADGLIGRVLRSQLWPDDNGTEWKRNVRDVEGEILCVSQFTLYTQLKQGNESDFEEAADIETARRLYDYFYRGLREAYNPERVKNGNFPAMLDGEWMNDGPVGFTFRSAHEAVTIEVNTKLPKTEKTAEATEAREERAEGEGKGRQEESGGKVEQTLEFQLPVSDVSRGLE